MRLRHLIVAGALCLPALAIAQQSPPAAPPAPPAYLQGLVSEEDVTALFDYLRSALVAAAEGREAPMPEDLRRRMEMLGADLKLRGTIGGVLLLKSLEAQIKELMRSPPSAPPDLPPPGRPYERLSATQSL
jgi:hypothetical protein